MALPLSLKGFLTQIRLNPLFGIHLLQAPVLVLKLLEPLHHRGVHAAKPRAPLIERRTADAVLSRQRSGTFTPASACLSTAMIWLSVNRDLRMWNLQFLLGYKIPLITSIIFRGDYLTCPLGGEAYAGITECSGLTTYCLGYKRADYLGTS